MTVLQVKSLSFLNRGPFALTINSTGCTSLSGESGSGKTLLLRAIADLIPHSGQIMLNNQDHMEITGPVWRKKVGLLPAESRWWRDTVGEHFTPDSLPLILPWFAKLGFGDKGASQKVLQWKVSRLSSGERQRLALIRLLANKPHVLLLDEPTANLDVGNISKAEKLIEEYRLAAQAAVLWVCHDPVQANRVAQNHYRLANGIITKESPA